MADLTKTAGGATITYTIDDHKSYTLLKVVASDGLILGAKMETGLSVALVLSSVHDQIAARIADMDTTPTEVADGTAAINYLSASGHNDFASVLDAVNKAQKLPNPVSDLNGQLKAIHARLDRIDDDLIAHYAGISQLVLSLAANPFTTGSAALSLKTYNFSSVGQKVLKSLLHLVPGYDQFKQLQHLDTAALVDGLEGKLDSQVGNIADTLKSQLETAAAEQVDAVRNQVTALATQASSLDAVTAANNALQAAISNGANSSVIATLTTNLASSQVTYNNAVGAVNDITDQLVKVDQLSNSVKGITGFLANLKNIAGGKTYSGIFKKA